MIAAGADINLPDEISGRSPAVAYVYSPGCDRLLYLLEHGAVYDVKTPQGSLLQRSVCDLTETRERRLTPMADEARENIEKTRAWLEEHGVRFDAKAAKVEASEKSLRDARFFEFRAASAK